MKREHPPVLALHATSRGFGFVVMSGPFSLVDWGTRSLDRRHRATCLTKALSLIDRFDPHTVVLEDPHQLVTRSPRIRRMYVAIAAHCQARAIDVSIIRRADLRQCFAAVGACTWQEIAEAVGRQLEPLKRYIPKRRKAWDSEKRGMAIFAAAAIAMVNWQRAETEREIGGL